MISDIPYWIWLQNAIGFGSSKVDLFLSRFGNLVEFYDLGLDFWISTSLFSKRELIRLCEPVEHFSHIVEKCESLGYNMVPISSDSYPFLLKQISNPPLVLYTKGDCSFLSSRCVSIVGSRRASSYGVQMSYDIAYDLSKQGITVVSGGALGADSAAHRGALSSCGGTICVLACGIDYPYLAQNEQLRNEISENGLLISEYPPSYPVQSFNFPIRNRIISGLSSCTVIVEASMRSGSLLTANSAAEQGRDVFVIPVKFDSYLSKGVNILISEGARVITCADDIISSLSDVHIDKLKQNRGKYKYDNCRTRKRKNKKIDLNEDEKKIFNIIKNGKIHIDEIVKKTQMPVKKISSILFRLELMELINPLPGKFYTARN